jgi:energy-converting hydrogenase Eha subunit A
VTSYEDFFAGSATIAGALVGLLFVSLSIQPERNRARDSIEHRAVAGTAFVALIDALFVSLIGLEPGGGLQVGAIVFGLIGLLSSGSLSFRLWQARKHAALSKRWSIFMGFIIIVYVSQLTMGLVPMSRLSAEGNTATFIYIMFGLGIARAWELLGMQSTSIIHDLRGSLTHHQPQPDLDPRDRGRSAPGEPPAGS